MALSHENVGPKIPAKIQIYIRTRTKLLITLCYEIPCTRKISKVYLFHFLHRYFFELFTVT